MFYIVVTLLYTVVYQLKMQVKLKPSWKDVRVCYVHIHMSTHSQMNERESFDLFSYQIESRLLSASCLSSTNVFQ